MLHVVPGKPCKAPIDVGLIRRSALDLVLKLEEHRRILFLVVAVEIQFRQERRVLVHDEMEMEEGSHTPSLIEMAVD